jgi:hypothetical protein
VLREAVTRDVKGSDEAREVMFARIMIDEPDRACGYTGDRLMEMDEDAARRASR